MCWYKLQLSNINLQSIRYRIVHPQRIVRMQFVCGRNAACRQFGDGEIALHLVPRSHEACPIEAEHRFVHWTATKRWYLTVDLVNGGRRQKQHDRRNCDKWNGGVAHVLRCCNRNDHFLHTDANDVATQPQVFSTRNANVNCSQICFVRDTLTASTIATDLIGVPSVWHSFITQNPEDNRH